MRSIFLSYTFRHEGRDLVGEIEQLWASHNPVTLQGRELGGGLLTKEIQRQIANADGLIALMARREQRTDGSRETHDWVQDEWPGIGLHRRYRDRGEGLRSVPQFPRAGPPV